MGLTPLDIAREFGPHREVEGELGAVMLDKNFAASFALSQGGRLLRVGSNNNSGSTEGCGDTQNESLRLAEATTGSNSNLGHALVRSPDDSQLDHMIPTGPNAVLSDENAGQYARGHEQQPGTASLLLVEMVAQFDAMDARNSLRFDAIESQFTSLGARLDAIDTRFASLEQARS